MTIYPLKHRRLREIGLFNREWSIKSDGYILDNTDGRPFSTDFAFTRFLVPHYAAYLGRNKNSFNVFVDSDFVFTRNVYDLFSEQDLSSKLLWCVKHDYKSPHIIKMDNQIQENYNKKLWSSFMIFHPDNPGPSLIDVNTMSGSWLHGFEWMRTADIGGLHEGWNFIPEHSEPRVWEHEIRAIHYTEGVPLMKPGCKYAEVFNNVLRSVLNKALVEPEILG